MRSFSCHAKTEVSLPLPRIVYRMICKTHASGRMISAGTHLRKCQKPPCSTRRPEYHRTATRSLSPCPKQHLHSLHTATHPNNSAHSPSRQASAAPTVLDSAGNKHHDELPLPLSQIVSSVLPVDL